MNSKPLNISRHHKNKVYFHPFSSFFFDILVNHLLGLGHPISDRLTWLQINLSYFLKLLDGQSRYSVGSFCHFIEVIQLNDCETDRQTGLNVSQLSHPAGDVTRR